MAQILIISDSLNLRISLAGILQRAGNNAQAVSPGEMPQTLSTKSFDLLIFELRTPYESGLSLLASVRSIYKMPVIVLSSATYPRVRQRAFIHGAAHFLVTPVAPEKIIQCVQQTIKREKFGDQSNSQSLRPDSPNSVTLSLQFWQSNHVERKLIQVDTDFIDIVKRYLR